MLNPWPSEQREAISNILIHNKIVESIDSLDVERGKVGIPQPVAYHVHRLNSNPLVLGRSGMTGSDSI